MFLDASRGYMNSLPLISIITPTYNHEKFIGPCIESVLKQAYQNWEQIVIDDGSTDRTAEVVRGFADPRIRYVHQENKGLEALAHTYNLALSICNGEFIAILVGKFRIIRRFFAIAVMGFIVDDEDVFHAHEVGHDALEHLAFGFKRFRRFACATLEELTPAF